MSAMQKQHRRPESPSAASSPPKLTTSRHPLQRSSSDHPRSPSGAQAKSPTTSSNLAANTTATAATAAAGDRGEGGGRSNSDLLLQSSQPRPRPGSAQSTRSDGGRVSPLVHRSNSVVHHAPTVPKEDREAFVNESIRLCLAARPAERTQTEATITVAADTIECTAYEPDPTVGTVVHGRSGRATPTSGGDTPFLGARGDGVTCGSGDGHHHRHSIDTAGDVQGAAGDSSKQHSRVLWGCAQRQAMFFSAGSRNRQHDCFVMVRTRHADVVAEVFQAPSADQAAECMETLASAFGVASNLGQRRIKQQRRQQQHHRQQEGATNDTQATQQLLFNSSTATRASKAKPKHARPALQRAEAVESLVAAQQQGQQAGGLRTNGHTAIAGDVQTREVAVDDGVGTMLSKEASAVSVFRSLSTASSTSSPLSRTASADASTTASAVEEVAASETHATVKITVSPAAAATTTATTAGDVRVGAVDDDTDEQHAGTVDFAALYSGYVETAPATGKTHAVHHQAVRLQTGASVRPRSIRRVDVQLNMAGGCSVVDLESRRTICTIRVHQLLACTLEVSPPCPALENACMHVCISRRHPAGHVFTHVFTMHDESKLRSFAERWLIHDELDGLDLQQKRVVLEQHVHTLDAAHQKTVHRLVKKLTRPGMDEAAHVALLLDAFLEVKYSTGRAASFSNLKRSLTASLDSLLAAAPKQPLPSRRPGSSRLRVQQSTTAGAAGGGHVSGGADHPEWKRDIFDKVSTRRPHLVTPTRHRARGRRSRLASATVDMTRSEFVRQRWRKAAQQQLLLVRMSSLNAQLEAEAAEVAMRNASAEQERKRALAEELWEALLSAPAPILDEAETWANQQLATAFDAGVSSGLRGHVWLWAAKRRLSACARVRYSYLDLLVEPSIYIHAIQIDIDRTFPEHPRFASKTSAIKRSLRNCMKAYSILDEDVGYCQGMSFVQGLLLLHLPEEDAFAAFVSLLYDVGLRNLYMPDMYALQRSLYCFSRLLHDRVPGVFHHLDQFSVEPFLYATPWFLTFFNTQFTTEFAEVVLDHLLVFGELVLYRVGLALLESASECVRSCNGFEETLRWLQTELRTHAHERVDAIMSRVRSMDVFMSDVRAIEREYDTMQSAHAKDSQEMQEMRRDNVFLRQHVNHAKAALQSLRVERDLWKTRTRAMQRYAREMASILQQHGLPLPSVNEQDTLECRDRDEFELSQALFPPKAQDKGRDNAERQASEQQEVGKDLRTGSQT
ncbi:hypothetical protein PTSG_07431 [Salpingoeca rosetta]|uniref:Rab-GAP TBC domain-containing protein n=1 Tax=Salpingoeca rosetta (strain ATCC 50818 / BSB-021) TaxID=946362 RepID=F2UIP4_SALR5|nr:uncharacterized protein PTSG_07431 [Salpingoeca rosetta]EGD77093.1 hypothetical protein PTSG_07431 [Salpingoeca rosetta]|eukprot:XP_004990932.1 hypothetical protein PTSG_07431 [Salpingoeca rosetta]